MSLPNAVGPSVKYRTTFSTMSGTGGVWRRRAIIISAHRVVSAMDGPLAGMCSGTVDTVVGDPTPSFRLPSGGRKAFRLKIDNGTKFVSARLLQTNVARLPPIMRVTRNQRIGIASDVIVTAASSAGWVTVTTGPLTVTAKGAIWIIFTNPNTRDDALVYIDNVQVA